MDVTERWILFLEKNPQFYELSKGDFFVRFLEQVSGGTRSVAGLRRFFPGVERSDLEEIMNAFLELKLISEKRILGKSFYSITKEGEKFLSEYEKTRRFYRT